MATINFIVRSENNPSAIWLRLKDGRAVDVIAKTNLHIDPKQWNPEKQKPRSVTDATYKKMANDIDALRAELLKEYNNRQPGTVINTLWLKNFINPVAQTDIPSRLVDYIAYYIDEKRDTITSSSKTKFNVVKHKLERYELYKKKHVYIIDVNKEFQKEFTKFCKDINYANNTIARDIRFIKTFCKSAKEAGLPTSNELEYLSGTYEKVDNIYLSFEELKNIKEAKLSEAMDNARDWLIISCYTGQRVSDFLRFDKSMIRTQKSQGKEVSVIEFTQKKTGKIMALPLHPEVTAILDKRGGDFPPKISDQRYNENIKIVCDEAGINYPVPGSKQVEQGKKTKIYRKESGTYPKCELVASHIGRRSFATNFYGIIPTPLLMAATGHSTEAMFLKYIGKSNNDRAMELASWF